MMSTSRMTALCREVGMAAGLPDSVAEVEEARSLLAILRTEYARLAAAARAAVAADVAGDPDPLAYVRAELVRRGGMPPRGASVPKMLADAVTAMHMASEAAPPSLEPGKPSGDDRQ